MSLPDKAFLCHASKNSNFVLEVAKYLKRNFGSIYYYEDYQKSDEHYEATINRELEECQVMVVFVGNVFTDWQKKEVDTIIKSQKEPKKHFFVILLEGQDDIPSDISTLGGYPLLKVSKETAEEALRVSKEIIMKLDRVWLSDDDLPLNPHLFDYEKDLIKYFSSKARLDAEIARVTASLATLEHRSKKYNELLEKYLQLQKEYKPIRKKQLEGCPAEWPDVTRWIDETIAKSDFQSNKLVLKLLNNKIIKNIENDPDRVYFDDSIKDEGQCASGERA